LGFLSSARATGRLKRKAGTGASVQTTLLGLAVALILALLTALVAPHFVNWSEQRAFFEAEASRLVGLNVQVAGPIKVSVLPSPSVTLADIAIGPAGQTSRLRARSLSIELGLGPLMRGEIRAVQARLVGPQFSIGLNSLGRIDWPAMTPQTETVAIERLNIEDGRAVLTDAASNSRLVLDKLWFRGQVRSLTGPFRGEGAFVSSGEIYGYRIAAGRLGDDGIKVKLNFDIAERPLAIEVEGMLASDHGSPRFDGSLALSRPAGSVRASGKAMAHEPWKLVSKVKSTAQSALLEQIEFQYGPEERAAKLDGAAEIKFGERPRLQSALSARQIDLDRLLATPDAPRRLPLAATQPLAELLGGMMRPSIPVSLTVSVDAVTLGGTVLQAFGGDLRSDGTAWRLDKLDFRAPGYTKISLSGRLDPAAKGIGFAGSASIDANDPKALIAWLAGHSVAGQVQIKPWQLRGDVTLGADRIAIEQLYSEFDRATVEGRLVYVWSAVGRPARLDAELRAGEMDFDTLLGFADGAFSGIGLEWPREIALALEVGRARIAGFEARNSKARVKLDAGGIQVERLSIADFGNASIEASGRIETTATPGGSIAVDLDARELNAVIALAEKFTPVLVDPLRRMAGGEKTAKLRATVSLENVASGSAAATLAIAGRVGAVRLDMTAGATGKPENFVVTDLSALAAADVRFDGRFEADDGTVLLAFLGLDRLSSLDRVAAARHPARLEISTTGPLNRELRIDGKLAVGVIDASGRGTLRLAGDQPATLHLDQMSGKVAGHKIQGRLAFQSGQTPRVDGAIEAETLDAPAVVAASIGVRSQGGTSGWATEPFAQSASDLAGRIEFKARRATLSPALEARQLRGVIRFDASDVVFEDVEGEVAKGRLGGRLAFAGGADGASIRARVMLSDADAAAIVAGDGQRPPIAGRLTLRAEIEGTGRSPAAFIGSLAGTGTVTLEDGQLAGLNPRVFDAVIRAVDLGIPTNADRIQDFVRTALENGTLPATRAEAAITIAAGQARLSNFVTITSGADLAVTANLDLADATLDAVLTLSGTMAQAGGLRPEILIALKGPWATPTRTIDANALSSWLALRAVEQQAKQIDTMERLQREANVPPAEAVPPSSAPATETNAPTNGGAMTTGLPNADQAPPLPAAIHVLPVRKPRAVPRVENPAVPPARVAAPPARAAAPKPPPPPPNPPLDLFGAQR
jgi:large subunit ribosomal protein L24